jgi:hypothetical protein
MLGSLLNIFTIPLRVVAAPLKLANRAVEDNASFEGSIVDTTRYVLTAKENHNDMDGFLDFDTDK